MAFSGLKNLLGIKGEAKKKEEMFENSEISPEMEFLNVYNLQHIGIPQYATKSFTYDRALGLAAVGTLSGSIKIFGVQGIEAMIQGTKAHPIEFLSFITNRGVLVSSSSLDKYLTVWSLEERMITSEFDTGFYISKLYYPEEGDFLYLGTKHGDLRVFDIENKRMTAYCVSFDLLCPDQIVDSIIDLQFHPDKTEKLLISYENNGNFIWDFKKSKIIKKAQNSCPVHCASWTTDGVSIICGLRDGSIVF